MVVASKRTMAEAAITMPELAPHAEVDVMEPLPVVGLSVTAM